ncbi:MAG: hypothetical protein ACODAU_00150 [Myxococcota bacterium]
MRASRWWLAAAALWAALPARAGAQACCTGTASGELGVVGPCRRALVSAQLTWEHQVGGWANDGTFRRFDGTRAEDLALTVAGGVRFLEDRLQLHGSLPVRMQHRALPGLGTSTRAGLGDAFVGLRGTIVEGAQDGVEKGDPSTLVPWVDLILGAGIPTGRAPDRTRDATGADIMGDGSWDATLGAKLTQFVASRHALTATFTWSHRFARQVEGRRFAPGARYAVRLAWLHIPSLFWSWGPFASLDLTAPAEQDGNTVAASRTRRLRVGLFATHAIVFPTWELMVGLSSDAMFDGGGRNVPFAGATLSVGIQRVFM